MLLFSVALISSYLVPSHRVSSSRRAPAPLCNAAKVATALSVSVDLSSGSRELLTFERLMKVKPFPVVCPYDGLELFAAADRLALQPPPSRAITATLQRRYREMIGWNPQAVLEQVSDGRTRLPQRCRRPGGRNCQLHGSPDSYTKGTTDSRGLQHCILPDLRLPGADTSEPSYALPFGDGQFGTVVSHHCVPYAVAPLPLFEELHRVLKPGGTFCLTFEGPPPRDTGERWAYLATCDPRSASLAWLNAADGADMLYMVASFFFYSGGWASLEVTELLPHSPASPAPLYQLTARKLSNRELFVLKASNDPGRGVAPPLPDGEQVEWAAAGKAAAKTVSEITLPPPPPRASATSNQQQQQQQQQPTPGWESMPPPARASPAARSKLQDVARANVERARVTRKADDVEAENASARVRRKILETIKRGIADNQGRADLEEGEQKMLEHMQLYVMETKVAESQLSDDDQQMWEQMKTEYVKRAQK